MGGLKIFFFFFFSHPYNQLFFSLYYQKQSSLSAVLDPRTKLNTFGRFGANNTMNEVIQELQNIISIYSHQENVVTTNIQEKTNSACDYFYSIVHQNIATLTTQTE